MDRNKESTSRGTMPIDAPDYIAITDEDGNVVAILDLIKKVLHYAGKELPFYLIAGPEEKEYPSFYAKALIKAANARGGRGA